MEEDRTQDRQNWKLHTLKRDTLDHHVVHCFDSLKYRLNRQSSFEPSIQSRTRRVLTQNRKRACSNNCSMLNGPVNTVCLSFPLRFDPASFTSDKHARRNSTRDEPIHDQGQA